MTVTRLSEAGIKVAILLALILVSVLLQAQDIRTVAGSGTQEVMHIVYEVNMEAKAMPLQHSINSPYDDIKPRLSSCGKRLYFSRNFHPENVNAIDDPEDIWYADFDSTSNTWSEAVRMEGPLNNAGPNYINNISASGDTIILGNQYLKKGKMRAGLSYSVKVNGEWSTPVAIKIEDDYNMAKHESSFVSLKNGIIISSVQRAESIGERDLFVSFWDGETATRPINMGDVINTGAEESSPFLAADNKTLFFASKGHDGFGGFDIFVTYRLDDSWTNWSTPQNLGPAVNGEMDDEFFSVSRCGTLAIFSKQVNVHNDDLYRIPMNVLFKNVDGQANKPAIVTGESVAKL